jgi:hypothetical protein
MSAAIFVVANIVDAYLTKIALAAGAIEANPIVASFGGNLIAKGIIAMALVFLLYCFRKERVLWLLNILFLGIILWNAATYLLQTASLPYHFLLGT